MVCSFKAKHSLSKRETLSFTSTNVGTAEATVISLLSTPFIPRTCTHAHHRVSEYKDFCDFFMNKGMAPGIKLNDYVMYKYKERIKEERLITWNIIDNIE